MNYKFLNNITGWAVFAIVTVVYFNTLEPTASLWDCGEYITSGNKLQVGHPPGAPVFMVVARLFSFFAAPENVATWINRCSALCSSFTILFLFWSITMLAKKILNRNGNWTSGDKIAAVGAGTVGALAYAFSDSFWFSAVEGEVYAMASLFTSIILWAILKWENEINSNTEDDKSAAPNANRWLLLIMYLNGLAIGVHLLGLLVIPSIGFVMYFHYFKNRITVGGFLLAGIISFVLLMVIQEVFIPLIPAIASSFEVGFANMGLGFYTGSIVFMVFIIAGLAAGLYFTKLLKSPITNTILWSVVFLIFGYSSFAVIMIRSNANTPLDENNPENLVTLHSYLKREQYGSWPVFIGPYWNSNPREQEDFKNMSPSYSRRFVVINPSTEEDVIGFLDEESANKYVSQNKGKGYDIEEKYMSTNESVRMNAIPTYEENVLFPRLYYNGNGAENDPKVNAYKMWSGYDEADNESSDIGSDGLPLPTYGQNMRYLFKYQLTWMYWRYFMWNFAGRQNDIQGHGDIYRGNWKSGFNFIDEGRIGDQSKQAQFTSENKGNNTYYLIPLILGVLGLIYHGVRAPKDAFIIALAFLLTGIAIIIFLNPRPLEPRERDYAYAGSFFMFCFWIGLSVLAMYEAYKNLSAKQFKTIGIGTGIGSVVILLFTAFGSIAIFKAWFVVVVAGAALLGFAFLLRKIITNNAIGAVLFTIIGLVGPSLMIKEGWDDHDRSSKTSASDLAFNYLSSCSKNGIIFTMGDNDTFPLWYLQEVEGQFRDIRVCNTSLSGTDWYSESMKLKAYESDPLPISFREDQLLMYAGHTDQISFIDPMVYLSNGGNKENLNKLIKNAIRTNQTAFQSSFGQYQSALGAVILNASVGPQGQAAIVNPALDLIKIPFQSAMKSTYDSYLLAEDAFSKLQDLVSQGMVSMPTDTMLIKNLESVAGSWTKSWLVPELKDAIDFAQNDENMLQTERGLMRCIPGNRFSVNVNVENAVKSGVITEGEKSLCEKKMEFSIEAAGIGKADLIILDVLAHNDWKRGLYFSSPAGTDVGNALYRSGYLHQNGIAWEIAPFKVGGGIPLDHETMFANLMKNYHFGDLKNPEVLTDYYARRQTTQFRGMFSTLVEYYLAQSDEIEMRNQQAQLFQGQLTDSISRYFKNNLPKVKQYRARAKELLKRAMEIMPFETVLDRGEPSANRRISPEAIQKLVQNGFDQASASQLTEISDGDLQDFVGLMLRVGLKTEAEELANKLVDDLEKSFKFFESVPGGKVFDKSGYEDVVSAYLNLGRIKRFTHDPSFKVNEKLLDKIDVIGATFFNKGFVEITNNALDDKLVDYSSTISMVKSMMLAYDIVYDISGTKYGGPNNLSQGQKNPSERLPQDTGQAADLVNTLSGK